LFWTLQQKQGDALCAVSPVYRYMRARVEGYTSKLHKLHLVVSKRLSKTKLHLGRGGFEEEPLAPNAPETC
jgi:hypothetical protein